MKFVCLSRPFPSLSDVPSTAFHRSRAFFSREALFSRALRVEAGVLLLPSVQESKEGPLHPPFPIPRDRPPPVEMTSKRQRSPRPSLGFCASWLAVALSSPFSSLPQVPIRLGVGFRLSRTSAREDNDSRFPFPFPPLYFLATSCLLLLYSFPSCGGDLSPSASFSFTLFFYLFPLPALLEASIPLPEFSPTPSTSSLRMMFTRSTSFRTSEDLFFFVPSLLPGLLRGTSRRHRVGERACSSPPSPVSKMIATFSVF